MIIPKSKSKLVTVIIHILIWVVFGLIYYFQPFMGDIIVPYQLWVKNGIIWSLLILAYYSNSTILVPKFLLKNRTGLYFVAVIGITTVIVLLNIYADKFLN